MERDDLTGDDPDEPLEMAATAHRSRLLADRTRSGRSARCQAPVQSLGRTALWWGGTAPPFRKETRMTIGTGIVLFVIGAILTFALDIQIQGVNLDMIGYILMAAGAVAFLIGLILLLVRRDRPRGTVVEDEVL